MNLRVSDNLVVSENSIFAVVKKELLLNSKGKITVLNNQYFILSGKYISFLSNHANVEEPVL